MLISGETAQPDTTSGRSSAQIRPPRISDGAAIWRLVAAGGVLDVNSSYAYLMLARDFSATSRVAMVGEDLAGFVVGYLRPDDPERLFIWQIAVSPDFQGQGVAGGLLQGLLGDLRAGPAPVRWLETTITDDNTASQATFAGLARRLGVGLKTQPLFTAEHFPDGHDPEPLYVVGPLDTPRS